MKKNIIYKIIILILIILLIIFIIYNFRVKNENTIVNSIENIVASNELGVNTVVDEDLENEPQYDYNTKSGKILSMEENMITIGYDDTDKEKMNVEINDNMDIINYETEEKMQKEDIKVNDYVNYYATTDKNKKNILIVCSNDYLEKNAKDEILGKDYIDASIQYMNIDDNNKGYILAEIFIGEKEIENTDWEGTISGEAIYYLKINVDDNTENYLGRKEDSRGIDWGYHLHELCTITLNEKISNLDNTYTAKVIEYIAD